MDISIEQTMASMGASAREAATVLATASADAKRAALMQAADAVMDQQIMIQHANEKDIAFGAEKGLSAAMMDRLKLDVARISGMAEGLRTVAGQEDPVGAVIAEWSMPSGLHIRRVRTPLGVIGVIFESRPNVTADAAALCVKSGNAAILRPGSEAFHSATAIHGCVAAGLRAAGLPENAVQLVPTRDRAAVGQMLTMTDFIDVIIPRGGKGLVGRVQAEARVPVFAHLEGIVHIYVDESADPGMARDVIMNAKTRRTGICGAAECLLIDRGFLDRHGSTIIGPLLSAGVEIRGDDLVQQTQGVVAASEEDWGREFLDMIIAARCVSGVDDAIAHIRQYGSQHTDCIISETPDNVEEFFNQLDSAILMHNASTQFADGGEFGMGAEIGIATGKIHARGPVGAEQLTSFKYLVTANGATRP